MNLRQTEILDLLNANGEVSVVDLAKRFGMSLMTIRRDLLSLEQQGDLTRTHGGAVLSKAGVVEFAFKDKAKASAKEKRAIAKRVAEWIQPGMKVSLDTGTTTLEVAKAISGMKDLTVLTASLPIASALYANDSIDLVLLGGMVRRGNPDLTGWLTEENLRQFRVDLAIIGSDGADRTGLYTSDANLARLIRCMISCAKQSLCAIDHRKFEAPSFVKCASWEEIDHLVTDEAVPPDVRKWLNKNVKSVTYSEI